MNVTREAQMENVTLHSQKDDEMNKIYTKIKKKIGIYNESLFCY